MMQAIFSATLVDTHPLCRSGVEQVCDCVQPLFLY